MDFRSSSQESRIRQELRHWEAENPPPARIDVADDTSFSGVSNSLTRTRSEYNFKLDISSADYDAAAAYSHFDGVDAVDLGLTGQVLDPGDLVEVRYAPLSKLGCLPAGQC